jgi:ribonuclease BN (tRNA processing enzyme)
MRQMTAHVMSGWKEDMRIRLHGLEPAVPQAYVVTAHDVRPGEIYRDGTIRAVAFRVVHGSWKYAYGYRFEAPDKTIVISGDTTYSPDLIAAAKGCDILVHEVYSAKGLAGRTPDWQRYHRAFHTSAPDVARIAAQVQPKKLVLYHQLPMGQPAGEILEEIRAAYQGDVIYGTDLAVIR